MERAVYEEQKWPIEVVKSAGFYLQNGSDCIHEFANLKLRGSIEFVSRSEPPKEVPMASLFDSTSHDHPYQNEVRKAAFARRSKGLRKDMFSKFDYVLVFTRREFINLLIVKTAFLPLSENTAKRDEKGKIVHLAQYLTVGKIVEICDPKNGKNGKLSRENWDSFVPQIKTAFRGFLKEELGWASDKP
jgi:hypothetical protein